MTRGLVTDPAFQVKEAFEGLEQGSDVIPSECGWLGSGWRAEKREPGVHGEGGRPVRATANSQARGGGVWPGVRG